MQLNQGQEAACQAIDGVYVCISGPGSGKTTVLIERYMRMLMQGIRQEDTLNLTFTNPAAEEMSRRSGLINSKSFFRTFHSFAIEILKKEREHLDFNLCSTVIPIGTEDYKLLFDLTRSYPAIKSYDVLKEYISKCKRSNIQPNQAIKEAENTSGFEYYYAHAYYEYEKKCRQQGWLDFDSLMDECTALLEANQEVRNRWKRKYISLDEAQDTSESQFRMIQLLFDGNIFAVGDENQNIYAWRGSQTENLTNFERTFPGAKKLYLGKNYRSTQKLVSFFKEILPVDNGIASHMVTDNPEGVEPTFTRYRDDEEEAVQVLKKVTDPVNTAIISRTNRQLFLFQRICVTQQIKYRILGKKDLWQQNEVKKLLHLAKESRDTRPADQVLETLIYENNLHNIYRNTGNIVDGYPIENLNSIVKMAVNRGTILEFLGYLRKLTHRRKSFKGLTLSTVHQSKSKEYDDVYLVGVNQEKMPHKDGETNEEKRIFFVACSRAAKTLNISFYGSRSEFLNNYTERIEDYDPEIGEVTEEYRTEWTEEERN